MSFEKALLPNVLWLSTVKQQKSHTPHCWRFLGTTHFSDFVQSVQSLSWCPTSGLSAVLYEKKNKAETNKTKTIAHQLPNQYIRLCVCLFVLVCGFDWIVVRTQECAVLMWLKTKAWYSFFRNSMQSRAAFGTLCVCLAVYSVGTCSCIYSWYIYICFPVCCCWTTLRSLIL